MYVRHRFSGIIQYQSLKILRHYLLASLQNPPIPQTAFYAHMPFEPPACERGHGTDCGKGRERKWKKPASCACTKEQAFSSDERRQPGTAKSGSSLLSLYTTYVRERASAGKGACALPPSSVFLPNLSPLSTAQSGIGAFAIVCPATLLLPLFSLSDPVPRFQPGVAQRAQ